MTPRGRPRLPVTRSVRMTLRLAPAEHAAAKAARQPGEPLASCVLRLLLAALARQEATEPPTPAPVAPQGS